MSIIFDLFHVSIADRRVLAVGKPLRKNKRRLEGKIALFLLRLIYRPSIGAQPWKKSPPVIFPRVFFSW
jgi:hypothetical protein